MGHADFRVGGKIFATLGAPDEAWGMAALMPEQQEDFMTSRRRRSSRRRGRGGAAAALWCGWRR